jgi:hypothetical protein
MEQWSKPITYQDQEAINAGMADAIARYHAGRDTPAPYVAPPKVVEQKPIDLKPTAIVTVKVGIFAVGATVVGSLCVAIASGITAFATAYAVEIGAVAAVAVVAALVVGGLWDSGTQGNPGSVAPKQEAKQTTINIHVNAAGGNVEVNKQ